ncbi:acriflavin resistance protein [Alkalispirochaeta sphaeroplastigenens]|uniref:Acriflavin resistance protein n=1 Tax=Alkalispirochaeta sphaeroplastigenens TaxID=1187066 RepID=A0A2S4JH40_9SPIO|nr:efflux RND transporter permease subunit [Alkalispirochaeta sphaeroplastigenens]POQ98805.1 acriflavin resistance protein [Alkalispirochaeta sphaeroplastigenens]
MIVRNVVDRPTTFFVIFAIFIGFGAYTALDLSIDLLPEIDPPVLLVTTDYDGAGPEEVERLVTRPLESLLSNVSNIHSLTSTTSQGSSMVIVEFSWGTNMDSATNDIRDRLELARGTLPDDASSPMIFRFDPSMIPVLMLQLTGDRSPDQLREIALDLVQPRLEQIEHIAQAQIQGGQEQVVRVDLLRNRLDAYGLTITEISQAVASQNREIGAGQLIEGDTDFVVRTTGEFSSLREIEEAQVARRGATPVRLGDLGSVSLGTRRETEAVYINGVPGVYINVQKQSDTNSVEAADNVIARLDRINRELPDGVRLSVINDTTESIRNSLATVTSQALMGALLAVIILFIFLRSLKSTLVVAVSIPASIVITLTIMYFAGLTLNLMTLAGLALGVGLLVDNSIVILENIYRYREKGVKLRPAALLGTREMVNAIVAATLTSVCVFVPLVLFRERLEIAGELFAGLAFTVVISLISSLLVAVFLVPVLASHYFPLITPAQRPLRGWLKRLDQVMVSLFLGLDRGYLRLLGLVLRHKIITTLLVLSLFGGSLGLIQFTGFELFPAQDEDSLELNVTMPVGTRLGRTEEVLLELYEIIRHEIAGFQHIVVDAGGGGAGGRFGSSSSHTGSITITLPPYEERIESAREIQERLRPYFPRFPGVEFSFGSGQGGLGGGRPISIRIRTDDTSRAGEISDQILEILETIPETLDPESDLTRGLPQIDVEIDRERAYAMGLSITTIGQEIRANIDGITASQFRRDGDEYDIVLILDEADRTHLPDLNRITVTSSSGVRVPLSSIASYRRTSGPVTIRREAQARQVTVEADLAPGAQLVQAEQEIRRLMNEGIPPEEGVVILFAGDFEDLQRYGQVFLAIIVVAILLVFGVMAAQFESFVDPFIIFFTIPLTLIGVIVTHLLMGVNLSILSAVGFVMLVGIVVNNGIVLVDYTNLLRKRGVPLTEACLQAGENRLRPILMTNLTTILGLVPVSFLEGQGSELIRPIGITVVGGLTASAILTLFFVPLLYAAINSKTDAFRERRRARLERRFEHHADHQTETEGPRP